jgi:multicomponent Na+:H+ antiporter subunit D
MTRWILAPLVIPLAAAAVSILLWRYRLAQRAIGLASSFALLVSSLILLWIVQRDGIQVVQVGGWPAPFGISLVADLFSAIMVSLAGIIGAAGAVYSIANIDQRRESYGFHPLYQILLMGVCGAFLTGDIFNLYVWFEVMLIASFVLLALGGDRAQLEGAFKYVTLNLVSSALFLAAVGLLYGAAGTLNMADLAVKLRTAEEHALENALAMLFLTTFGIKAAIFPLFFWLPASYHTPPVTVSAVFAGLLTKVGVYALIRVFTLLFVQDVPFTHGLILVLSGLTMVTGVLGAAAQNDFRRILSFHIISQIGYMVMGLGLFTRLAVAGSVFYIIHHIIVKTNLFLISGMAHRMVGSNYLKEMGGLYRTSPALSILFLIPAMSLAGIPPLSGFFSKLILIRAGLDVGGYLIVGVALAVGLLTLFSMTKIWTEAFWKSPPAEDAEPGQGQANTEPKRIAWAMWLPALSLALLTVTIGFAAGPVFELSERTAQQLMNPGEYIETVLRSRP